jgi:hypothetical protein
LLGGVIAALIAAFWMTVIALVGLASGPNPRALEFAFVVVGPAIPITAILAAALTPSAIRTRSVHRAAITLGVGTVVASTPFIALAAVLWPASTPYTGDILSLSVLLLLFYGPPGVLIAIPSAYVWILLLHRLVAPKRRC